MERLLFALLAVSMLFGGLMLSGTPAQAQSNDSPPPSFNLQDANLIPICSAFDGAVGIGGFASIAVQDLRAATAPNPPTIAAALDTLEQADDSLPGDLAAPASAQVDAARDVLISYFGPACSSLFGNGGPGRALVETCAAFATAINTGGEVAVVAIKDVRAYVEPTGVLADALDTLQDAESGIPPSGSRPTSGEVDAAVRLISSHFDLRCGGIDVCPFVLLASTPGDPSAADAARVLRGLTAPAPPGIDAALALISGAVDASPFHTGIADAQIQVQGYFPCNGVLTLPPLPFPTLDVLETCADLNVMLIPEGPRAIQAAERLRARGAPNPPGIEAALDTVVAFADLTTAEPSLAQVDQALLTLAGYFGGPCIDFDRCPLVIQTLSTNPAVSAPAASLLWRLETPAPPGIGAALFLISGEGDSPFHNSVAEAQAQIASYYPCQRPVFTG